MEIVGRHLGDGDGYEIFAEGGNAVACYRLAEGSVRLVKLMVLLCHKSAQERIAWFLLDLADANGAIHLPMTRTDIANYLGMAIETVSRTLGQLKQSGAIAQKSLNRIQILDRDALELARGEV